MPPLDIIPQEVLEHIAFFVATSTFLGPPSDLVPLLASSRRIYSQLSITSNPHLYARVFTHKFDLKPAMRRLGKESFSPVTISAELRRRFIYLKRLRARADAYQPKGEKPQDTLHQLLLHSCIWLLESDGRNERQLREYGKLDCWLHDFWFSHDGASRAMHMIQDNEWPIEDQNTTLAMWLYWLLVEPDGRKPNDKTLDVLGAFALAAHRYNISVTSWLDFLPSSTFHVSNRVTHFDQDIELTFLPVAIPAILSFLTLVSTHTSPGPLLHPSLPLKSVVRIKPSSEWDSEWARCKSMAQSEHNACFTEAFKPGR
ncbi:hypothetical protein Ac2012v2_006230 [Leucoagaricus gongylophorus]